MTKLASENQNSEEKKRQSFLKWGAYSILSIMAGAPGVYSGAKYFETAGPMTERIHKIENKVIKLETQRQNDKENQNRIFTILERLDGKIDKILDRGEK